MPAIEYETQIASSPEQVFEFLANFDHDAQWRQGVVEMQALGNSGDRLGGEWSRQVEVRKVPGRIVRTQAVVTDFVRPSRLAVQRASGPVRPHAIYEISSQDGGGATKLRFRLDVPLSGGSWALWPVVMLFLRVAVRPTLDGDFRRLRALVEKS